MSTSFNLIIWMNGYVMFGHLYSNSELGSRFARILKMAPCKFMRTVAIPLPPPGPSCTSCWGSQDLWQFCSVLAGVGPANGVAALIYCYKFAGSFVSLRFLAQLLLCALPRPRLTVNSAFYGDSHFIPHSPTPSHPFILLLLLLLFSICLEISG